jgi:hypothetical protein
MKPNNLRRWLRRPQAGFRCGLGAALELIAFRVHSSFIIHLYGRPAERAELREVLRTAASLGFSPSEVITCADADGVAADYAQAVLNASSLIAASAKMASLLEVAAKGKPLELSSVRRSPAFRLVVTART